MYRVGIKKFVDIILSLFYSKRIKVINKLSQIPNINSGGCGISALAMYRLLGKKNIDILFLYRNYEDVSYVNNQNILKGDADSIPSPPLHVVLHKKGKYFDSYGEMDERYLSIAYMFRHKCDESFLVDTINNRYKWNLKFNRKYIKYIERKLKVDLSDIK